MGHEGRARLIAHRGGFHFSSGRAGRSPLPEEDVDGAVEVARALVLARRGPEDASLRDGGAAAYASAEGRAKRPAKVCPVFRHKRPLCPPYPSRSGAPALPRSVACLVEAPPEAAAALHRRNARPQSSSPPSLASRMRRQVRARAIGPLRAAAALMQAEQPSYCRSQRVLSCIS